LNGKPVSLFEWLSVNTLDIFNEISALVTAVFQNGLCTCPDMTAGPLFSYLWRDGVRYKKPTSLPAKMYITNLMNWVESQLDDESVFPLHHGCKFPSDFHQRVKLIYKRLFRVYAHFYHHHYKQLEKASGIVFLNISFKRFIFFATHFDLIGKPDTDALDTLIHWMLTHSHGNPQVIAEETFIESNPKIGAFIVAENRAAT
jgi:MOB kinase activator 1